MERELTRLLPGGRLAPGVDLRCLAGDNAAAARACLAGPGVSRFRDALSGLVNSVAAASSAPA